MSRRKLGIEWDEPSTWRGCVRLAAFALCLLWPDQIERALTVAAGLSGALGFFVPDRR